MSLFFNCTLCYLLFLFLFPLGDWPSEGMGTGSVVPPPSGPNPPVPTPGAGFLAAGDQDWNVDTTTTTKDWAEDNAGEWGGDAAVS